VQRRRNLCSYVSLNGKENLTPYVPVSEEEKKQQTHLIFTEQESFYFFCICCTIYFLEPLKQLDINTNIYTSTINACQAFQVKPTVVMLLLLLIPLTASARPILLWQLLNLPRFLSANFYFSQ